MNVSPKTELFWSRWCGGEGRRGWLGRTSGGRGGGWREVVNPGWKPTQMFTAFTDYTKYIYIFTARIHINTQYCLDFC